MSAINPRNHIKVFIASTVYDFQPKLDMVYNVLDSFGYDVINSHKGTCPLNSKKSNLNICLDAVCECDVFIGFIGPNYGSGVLEQNGKSIIHLEFEKAIEVDIPRFILTDYRVPSIRYFIRKTEIYYKGEKIKLNSENITINKIMEVDIRCVRLYEEMIKTHIPPKDRIGHWVQEYKNLEDILLHIESQFKYPERIRKLIGK